ncbi:hypothetical protein EJ02DRAFT_242576 [Clathrospora elynae]|uniref:Uncharacterized protein n=1 Tax=Clathrospora elynae TaxID=706981 RepID=A0A6A5SJJ2_9PLEO|nr:hypothetical protein EJ02DRAFT_242576 [Clathrospora elynae]
MMHYRLLVLASRSGPLNFLTSTYSMLTSSSSASPPIQCLAKTASPRTQVQQVVRHITSRDQSAPPSELGIALTCQNTRKESVVQSFSTTQA